MSATQSSQTGRPRAKSPKKNKHRLTVIYDGNQIADLDVERFQFNMTENGVRIEAGDAVSQGGDQSEKAKAAVSQLVNALSNSRTRETAQRQITNGHVTA